MNKTIKWLCVISGIAALLAILPTWPYLYYQLLRWLICVSALVSAYGFYKAGKQGWLLTLGAVALLFNPLYPIFMTRSSWTGIDLVVTVIFFIAAVSSKKLEQI